MTFRLAPGVDEHVFRSLDERVQTGFVYHQPGILRRTLGRHDDGRWLALTVWADASAAAAAERAFAASSLGIEFAAAVTDVVVDRFHGVD